MISYQGAAGAWQLAYTICVVLWVLIIEEAYRNSIPYLRALFHYIKNALYELRTHTRRKENWFIESISDTEEKIK